MMMITQCSVSSMSAYNLYIFFNVSIIFELVHSLVYGPFVKGWTDLDLK